MCEKIISGLMSMFSPPDPGTTPAQSQDVSHESDATVKVAETDKKNNRPAAQGTGSSRKARSASVPGLGL